MGGPCISRFLLPALLTSICLAAPGFVGAKPAPAAPFDLTSDGFEPSGRIPDRYTCVGENVSPPLRLAHVPPGTQSVVLLMDDPDAPERLWKHWVLFNLPPDFTELPENLSPAGPLPPGAVEGENSWHLQGYGGPCPPKGRGEHRYVFKAFALDRKLDLRPGVNKDEVVDAMRGHILGRAVLMGTYSR